jgi:tRNA1Val (adenine37-N6)-methyltransferase
MSNQFFQFKQFSVTQSQTAMKVTTDSCLFGAWLSQQMPLAKAHRALDIGAGTGLLSLMYAQQHPTAYIDAVEIEPGAAAECLQNVQNSKWAAHIQVQPIAIQQWQTQPYEYIICNPPFYEKELQANTVIKNLAHHSSALTLEQLLEQIERLLIPKGRAAILIPYKRQTFFTELLSQYGWHIITHTTVFATANKPAIRCMYLISKQPATVILNSILIKNTEGVYTSNFIDLLQPYYLHL